MSQERKEIELEDVMESRVEEREKPEEEGKGKETDRTESKGEPNGAESKVEPEEATKKEKTLEADPFKELGASVILGWSTCCYFITGIFALVAAILFYTSLKSPLNTMMYYTVALTVGLLVTGIVVLVCIICTPREHRCRSYLVILVLLIITLLFGVALAGSVMNKVQSKYLDAFIKLHYAQYADSKKFLPMKTMEQLEEISGKKYTAMVVLLFVLMGLTCFCWGCSYLSLIVLHPHYLSFFGGNAMSLSYCALGLCVYGALFLIRDRAPSPFDKDFMDRATIVLVAAAVVFVYILLWLAIQSGFLCCKMDLKKGFYFDSVCFGNIAYTIIIILSGAFLIAEFVIFLGPDKSTLDICELNTDQAYFCLLLEDVEDEKGVFVGSKKECAMINESIWRYENATRSPPYSDEFVVDTETCVAVSSHVGTYLKDAKDGAHTLKLAALWSTAAPLIYIVVMGVIGLLTAVVSWCCCKKKEVGA